MAGKKQAPAKIEDEEDEGSWEDAVVDADGKEAEADLRLRDWRDVERYREMKDLRRLVDDDYGFEEIFHVPLKVAHPGAQKASKGAAAPPAAARPQGKAPAVPAKPASAQAKPAAAHAKPAHAPAKSAHPPSKTAAAKHKLNPKLKAKAKRK